MATFAVTYSVYPKLGFTNQNIAFSANIGMTGTFDPTWTSAYTVLFGDGQSFTSTSARTTTHAYTGQGNYVSFNNFKVTSATGETYYTNTSAVGNIKINPIPEVGFIGTPSVLSALSFYDVNGGYYITDTIVSADWDFGDSSLSSTTDIDGTLSHTYSNAGTYTVQISAYDISGNVGVGSKVVGIFESDNCVKTEDYITICGPSMLGRFGANRNINLTNFLPDYLKGGEVESFMVLFEEFLNEMYDGSGGWLISGTDLTVAENWENNSGTSDEPIIDFTYDLSGDTINTTAANVEQLTYNWPDQSSLTNPKMSILEKVHRLTELHDPDLIDLEYIQFFAQNLGYNVNVNRSELGVSGDTSDSVCGQDEINKYLRFVVSNLPTWYKIKTTRNAIKVMLYSFGLIGDIIDFFTKDYKPVSSKGNWIFDLNRDLADVPNGWYPTPHFAIMIQIDDSSDISFDISRRDKVIRAIESIRPINTVFRKLVGYLKRTFYIETKAIMRMTRYIDIKSDGFSN